ncbi:MAG: hypothetical protein ABIQ95_15320 [Bdellovibrionia bacterium]
MKSAFRSLMFLAGLANFIPTLSSPLVWASDFQSSRTSALGGAGHAAPVLTDAIYQNPSYIAMIPVRAMSLNYLTYPVGVSTGPFDAYDSYKNNYNLAAQISSRESQVQYGIGYTQRENLSNINAVISIGSTDQFSIGFGTKIVLPANGLGTNLVDLNFSMSGIANEWFRAALMIDNLVESGQAMGLYREVTLGTKFNLSVIQLYLDPLWVPSFSQSNWGYELGVEYPFFDYFFLRLGTFSNAAIPYQSQRGDGFGTGIGIMMPSFSVNYAYSQVIQPTASFAHHFETTFYF